MSAHPKFTKGPWVVCTEDGGDAAVTIFAASQLRDWRIAADEWDDCIALAGLNHNESEANARLIAAAPELYDALADVIGWVSGPEKWHTDAPALAVDRARAALAKARGEA